MAKRSSDQDSTELASEQGASSKLWTQAPKAAANSSVRADNKLSRSASGGGNGNVIGSGNDSESPLESSHETGSNKKLRPSSQIMGISRAISACQRCRIKKIKCDQNFPKCSKCDKAHVECIGLDPATGREVPRSYVIHLEDRIAALELKLKLHGLDPNIDNIITNAVGNLNSPLQDSKGMDISVKDEFEPDRPLEELGDNKDTNSNQDLDEQRQHHELLNEVRFNSINPNNQLISNSRYISTNLSISFAKLMSTAVKFRSKRSRSVSTPVGSNRIRMATPMTGNTTNSTNTPEVEVDPSTTVSKEEIQLSLLPPKKTAQEFLRIFFAQSNAQIPILHREEFLKQWFIPIYGKLDDDISLASDFSNINTSYIYGDKDKYNDIKEGSTLKPGKSGEMSKEQFNTTNDYANDETLTWFYQYKQIFNHQLNQCRINHEKFDPIKTSNNIKPPLKYHKCLYFLNIIFGIASSVHHLQYPKTISDSFKLTALKYIDQVYSSNDQLESLQGILLLALYSIMRPAVPGCWYLVGSALRLCIDLGLHNDSLNQQLKLDSFMLDKRRRLFWCTYALDRQICFYLTRPVGIPDECITTPFPSLLDDSVIIPKDSDANDYLKLLAFKPPESSYKYISIAIFEIRKIQSEVQKILFENYELPRKFSSLVEWKQHIFTRLKSWKSTIPKTKRKLNCDFTLDFFYLNYNHTLLILFGLSPKNFKLSNQDLVKVNESSKGLIEIYSNLLSSKSINYTWAAILNLFTAGISYLYSIYNSDLIRNRNSLADVKKYTQDCITVLNSLVDRCDAAFSCKNTYEVLTAAVVKLKYNETVYGHIKLKFPENISFLKPYSNNNLNTLVHNLKSEQEEKEKQEQEEQEKREREKLEQQQFEMLQQQRQELLQQQIPQLLQYSQNLSLLDEEYGGQYDFSRNNPGYESFSVKLENDLNPFLLTEFTPSNASPVPQAPSQQTSQPQPQFYEQSLASSQDSFSKPIIQQFLDNQPETEVMGFQSPSTFEWSNSNNIPENELDNFFNELENSPNSTNSRRDSFSDNNDLIGSNLLDLSRPQSLNNPLDQPLPDKKPGLPYGGQNKSQFLKHPSLGGQQPFIDSTPYSMESNDSSDSSPVVLNNRMNSDIRSYDRPQRTLMNPDGVPSKDGRKIFELIHQVPIDSIWDQFFTSNSSLYSGLNFEGLSLLLQ